VQTISDHLRWTGGYGLGLQLLRDGERILAGHGGSMPGFIAGVYFSPADKIGAAILTNSSSARLGPLACKLVAEAVERWPVPPEPWRVDEPPPDEVVPLLGIWFMEGDPLCFRWREGRLEAQFSDAADWEEPAVLTRETGERWRIVSGWEHGEALRIEAERLVLAGYPVTREPTVWV
jgi:CubicO group peptidase (beta-lactamase class C family)